MWLKASSCASGAGSLSDGLAVGARRAGRASPALYPILTAGLLDKLVAAAQPAGPGRKLHDLLAPHHWRRALDSVPGHRSRGCPAVRHFLKVVSARLLPDPGAGHWVDPQQSGRALMTDQSHPRTCWTRPFFTTQLWPLLRALGPGTPGLICPWLLMPVCRPCDLKILVAVLQGPRALTAASSCRYKNGLEPEQALVQQIRRTGQGTIPGRAQNGWRIR